MKCVNDLRQKRRHYGQVMYIITTYKTKLLADRQQNNQNHSPVKKWLQSGTFYQKNQPCISSITNKL